MNFKFLLLMNVSLNAFLINASSISLEKAMHHKNVEKKNILEAPLELGKIVFYFTQMPEIKQLSQHSTTTAMEMKQYFFPAVSVTPSVNEMINALKKLGNYYAINITATQKPQQGLLLTVEYDPKKIIIQHDTFVSIGMQKGIVFYFYNKQLIDILKNKDERILQTVWGDKKKMPIVIDCGHGGQDTGAISADGLTEKEITLSIGKQVAHQLVNKGYEVAMTRTADQTLALDERTTFANIKQGLLLVSIHANYAPNKQASGLETFFFDSSLMQSEKNNNNEIIYKFKKNLSAKSSLLSSCLHEQVFNEVKKKNPIIVDRKVKKAVSQILLGSTMPAALIEVGFLSNSQEAKLLHDQDYLLLISEGISNGIITYLESLS